MHNGTGTIVVTVVFSICGIFNENCMCVPTEQIHWGKSEQATVKYYSHLIVLDTSACHSV